MDRDGPRITAAMCARGRVLGEPRLSPDGERVAFVANAAGLGQLAVVAADGSGPEVALTASPGPKPVQSYGGGAFDWTPAGDVLFAGGDGRLYELPAAGGPARPLLDAEAGARPAAAPAVSPDGERVAF